MAVGKSYLPKEQCQFKFPFLPKMASFVPRPICCCCAVTLPRPSYFSPMTLHPKTPLLLRVPFIIRTDHQFGAFHFHRAEDIIADDE
jgi:hypothetical protein